MRLSGLQKEVLALYRQCLRECRKKPQVCAPQRHQCDASLEKNSEFVIQLTWAKEHASSL
jgi:hypothetical protein